MAKHGQSPIDPLKLTRINDGPLIDGVNGAREAAHPGAGPLVLGGTDDAIMWWLTDWLMSHSATGNTSDGSARTLPHSGLCRPCGRRSAQAFQWASPARR